MAEDFPDDMDGFDSGMLGWFYVEDDYPLADELAETQIPSPGYAGTKGEIEGGSFDFDMFDYWDDLEYGDDEYWDHGGTGKAASDTGQKRKRDAVGATKLSNKKRKLDLKDTGDDDVRFVRLTVRNAMMNSQPPLLAGQAPFSLLPDWKERFANDSGVVTKKAMPEAMKKAAEAKETDTPPKQRIVDAMLGNEEDEEWMDEDGEEEGEDLQAQLASLDPETLKAVLKQKLGDAGLAGMDEGAFMQTIAKMLSGGDGAEDAAGDLANSLLGQATQGNDSALSGWLSQQGVSVDAAEAEDDDISSVATAEVPETATSKANPNIQSSPPDSAIGISKGNRSTAELAIHPPSLLTSAKKRTAPAEDQEGAKKRKKVTFDVPPSSESIQAVAEGGGDEDSTEVQAPDPLTSEDPLMSETTIQDEKTRAASSKAGNATTMKNHYSKSTGVTGAAKSTSEKVTTKDSAPPKQTRKRKAEADNDEVGGDAPTKTKQPKKTTKPSAPKAEPPTTRTRSAGARVRK